MASTVQWRLMFRVANRAAFDKCLTRALPLLGPGCVAGAGRPYWKVTELWECELTTPSGDGSVADQVLLCLLSAQRLASGWFVLGPLSAEGADDFSGVFALGQSGASSHVAGLEWASFQLGSGSKA